jgi:hypothetical protein
LLRLKWKDRWKMRNDKWKMTNRSFATSLP